MEAPREADKMKNNMQNEIIKRLQTVAEFNDINQSDERFPTNLKYQVEPTVFNLFEWSFSKSPKGKPHTAQIPSHEVSNFGLVKLSKEIIESIWGSCK